MTPHKKLTQTPISVLIVEDDPMWAEAISDNLGIYGFDVAGIVSSFEAASQILNHLKFDIAIVDIQINGRNSGIDLGKILTNRYNKPFIFLTAYANKHTTTDALEAKPSAYLVKPIDPVSLFMTIQTALQNFSNKVVGSVNLPVNSESFFVKVGDKYKKIVWKEVVYLTSDKNYTSLFNSSDSCTYYIRSTLSKTLDYVIPVELKHYFIQINRAEAINTNFIKEITSDEVFTAFGSLTLTETYSSALKTRLNIIR